MEIDMNFLSKLLQAIAFVPAIVNGAEGLFGNKSAADKKSTVLSFASTAISAFQRPTRLRAKTSSIPTGSRTASAR